MDEITLSNKLLFEDTDIPLSNANAWGKWLAEQQRVALDVYRIKPSQLVADQRREQGISRDYKGREILELLQNAADAARKAMQHGHARIELSSAGLLVANTGVGFTTGGVSSLQTADLSPKRSKNSQMIGSKGLGFRSVLNWSLHPIILSGELRLAYNSAYAEELVESLAQDNDSVRVELESERNSGGNPIPLLPFPIHLDPVSRRYVNAIGLLERAETLKDQGYNTVIAMPFDRDNSFKHAYEQLQELRPEFLFFSEWTETLSVRIEHEGGEISSSEKTWRLSLPEEGAVVLSESDPVTGSENSRRWRLFRKEGEIPAEFLQDSDDPDRYHLVVALQEEGLAQSANLYSFFPTSIPLPLHALCHASLELEQNRKHLQEGEANSFVLQRLAAFLAEIFEQQVTSSGDHYRAIDLLSVDELLNGYPEDIRVLQSTLIEEIKGKRILPTISNNLVAAQEGNSLPSEVINFNWLPKKIFPKIVVSRNSKDRRLYDRLNIKEIDGAHFISLLRKAELSIKKRAKVAQGIIDSRLDRDYYYKGLLLDSAGNELSEDDSVFLPGGSLDEKLRFPAWANVKILNDELWKLLRKNKARDSAKALSIFGVQEYALSGVIAGLVSAANRAVDTHDEFEVRSALLGSLYELYCQYEDGESRPGFPVQLSAILLHRKNEWVRASQLYFGSGYGYSGEIVGCLYKSLPEKLVAAPEVYGGLGMDLDLLPDFLRWLGVVTWPKLVTARNVESEFLDFTLPRLKFPAVFSESDSYIFESAEDIPRNCRYRSVESLDDIEAIIKSDSDAILAWLASDVRSTTWLRNDNGHGKLVFVPSGARNDRVYKGELPSYINWKIKHSPWLNCEGGTALAPVRCMVNDAAVAGLFPRPIPPSKEAMEQFSLDASLLKHAWINAGVKEGIDDLNSEELYALLFNLSSKDPEGKLAKKLYNWLIKTVDFGLNETGSNYLSFIDDGKILAKSGDDFKYFRVDEAYHVDVEGFPGELLRTLPVACLLKKRGAEKVRRLFGVNVLDKVSVNEQVVHHHVAACTTIANEHFQLSKRYIEIYRHNHSAKPQLINTFNRLELIVCTQVTTQITFKNKNLTSHLPPWTYSIQGEKLFVSCDLACDTDAFNPLLANAIGDAIASLFGLTEGNPFAQIYQCDETSRAELLAKMLGDELDDDLDAELQRLKEEIKGQGVPEPVVTMGPVVAQPTPLATPPEPSPPPTKPSVGDPSTKPDSSGWNIPTSISIEPVKHELTQPGAPVARRISGGGGSGSSRTVSISDGKAGETLAMLFEEQQGRFPLLIGHITGYETITADVLSFRTDKDRALFESGDDQNASLIERVIEAKEGVVRLTNNEVNTASEWKDKYYIYQFKQLNVSDAEYELVMLQNPLIEKSAISSTVEVALERAKSAERFRVTGND